jgi:hypothetical protein
MRDARLGYVYNMTRLEYDQLIQSQASLCAVCLEPLRASAFIDHDHESGKVRGVLCARCNSGLGEFRDNQVYLQSAQRYLAAAIGV